MISSSLPQKTEFEKKTIKKKKLIRFSVAYDILFHTVDSLSKCHPSYTIIRVFFYKLLCTQRMYMY